MNCWTTNYNSKASEGACPGYYNTPPCWPIYVTGLNVSYMNQRGGLDVYRRESQIKSSMLWDTLESSNGYYVIKMEKAYRSRVNCVFRIRCPVKGEPELEKKLQAEAAKHKITNLAGHVVNPGIRVSMYNAMPIAGVVHLCHFLVKFMKENPVNAQKGSPYGVHPEVSYRAKL